MERFAADPYPVYDKLLSGCPVAHSGAHGGFWILSRYEEVRAALLRPEVFSNRYPSIPKDVSFGDFVAPPLQLDPPEHTRFKALLTPAFLPQQAAALEDETRRIAVELLDALTPGGGFDVARDFASPFATRVICLLMGAPDAEEQFMSWLHRIIEEGADHPEGAQQAGLEAFMFIADVVARRKAEPGPDVISRLIEVEVDGDHLDDMEITLASLQLLTAGVDTTWHVLASAAHYLAEHPSAQDELRAHPDRIPHAREEFLRAFAPVLQARVLTEDTELGGRTLAAGDSVLLLNPAANRDRRAFEQPDEVLFKREPNRHLAFGAGVHRCLGVNIARMELLVALEEFLCRVPPFRLFDPARVLWSKGPICGPKRVEIIFDPPGGR